MDYDSREFLDPDEEYEMMYAEEEEIFRELENTQARDISIARKAINFNDEPKQIHRNGFTSLNTVQPNSVRTSKSNVSQLVPDYAIPSTSKETPESFNSIYDSPIPSTSKESPPFPFVDIDGDSNDTRNEFRISVNGVSCSNSQNKRSVDELFGDIDDIDFGTEPIHKGVSKRSRMDDHVRNYRDNEELVQEIDKDLLLIDKILMRRKKLSVQDSEEPHLTISEIQKLNEDLLSRRVPKYAFMSLRNGKNEKFYAKLISEDTLNNRILSVTEKCKTCRLLAIPFESILVEANAILDKKFAAQERANSTNSNFENIERVTETELWVEKYKPKAYLHLLSDEGTNRTLLQWLKMWDKMVFGRESIRTKKLNRKPSKFPTWNNNNQLENELDDKGCPKHKVALLCGPPGLGKTTLAHVIACHAGYNVVEMNASDDRSPDIFRRQLEAATQMKSVIGKTPKPNCLVIDEIDGAPTLSIEYLIKFVKGDLKNKGKSKSNKKPMDLKRPIICICNDVYVPALRSLRQMAFVLYFPPTPSQRLAQRLIQVAENENIKTDVAAMLALCDKTNNDIRTCISTLYCLKNEPISRSTILNATIGTKDMQKGLFAVWQEIFQIQTKNINIITTDIASHLGQKTKSDIELFRQKRMVSVLRTVHSNGDYDRLMLGVHENLLNMSINDSSMKNVSVGLEWFCFMDHIKTTIASSQMYTLMAYMPYSFVAWNFLFASYQKPNLKYPNSTYELSIKRTKLLEIVQEVLKGMEAKVRAYCHNEQLLLDTLPIITYILNPAFRQISIQLFSEGEKKALRQLVNTMIDYNLNFVQERTQEGSYEFNLDPNVDHVVEFPGITKQKHLTYSLKLMIAREIEQEKIRRLEKILLKSNINDDVSKAPKKINENAFDNYEDMVVESATEVTSIANTPRTQNHLQKLTPKVVEKLVTGPQSKDFFGRIIERPAGEHEKQKVDEIIKSDIWFHFKEGFSNAVRRTVYIKDLLQ